HSPKQAMPDGTEESERKLNDLKKQPAPSVVIEFVQFIREEKIWWIAPIIFVVLMLGLLVVLGGTGALPFIYTFF
ncbi:MAG: DUF5989 family protein, partial [bacterium]|nr:DUF5989 family protein [bacterium]